MSMSASEDQAPERRDDRCGRKTKRLIGDNNEFLRELGDLLNRYSIDAHTDTPDFLLADFLASALDNYQSIHDANRKWPPPPPMEHRQMHVQEG